MSNDLRQYCGFVGVEINLLVKTFSSNLSPLSRLWSFNRQTAVKRGSES